MKDKQKRKQGDWHHRVPDFELVYCGPKKKTRIKQENIQKQTINVSKTNRKFEKKEQLEQNLQ